MKNLKRILIAALAILAVGTTASAQFKWGVKAGVNINKMHFDKNEVVNDIKNNAGYQVGLEVDFTVPIVGIGVESGLMFNHRNFGNLPDNASDKSSANFLDIPLHLLYKFSLPAVGNLVAPYIFLGPDFAFNLSAKDAIAAYTEKKFDCFLDMGIGVQLINHLKLGVGYSLGLNKALIPLPQISTNTAAGTAKINGWTITLAYLF